MKKALVILSFLSAILLVALDTAKVAISGKTDKSALSYAPGETMEFTFNADLAGQDATGLYLYWEREGDDGKTFNGKCPANETATVKTSLDKPGFVRMTVFLVDKDGKKFRDGKKFIAFYAGAAVQPETLTDCGEPADFDAFWAKQMKRLNDVPFVGKVERVLVKETPEGNIYTVKIPCAGPRPVTGYLTIPKNAAPKSLPIIVQYFGYSKKEQAMPKRVNPKSLVLEMNAHGVEMLRDKQYYKNFFNGIKTSNAAGKVFTHCFNADEYVDPETCYFNGMALRAVRGVQFMKTLPEWNGKQIYLRGGSQGGLQSTWAAALEPGVTDAYVFIVWCCDIAGQSKKGRLSGNWRIEYAPNAEYYDATFHAKRIKNTKVVITRAGLGDYISPPSGLAIYYRNLATPDKSINWVQGSDHSSVPKKKSEIVKWKNK